MRYSHCLYAFVLLFLPGFGSAVSAQNRLDYSHYHLVFAEEFDSLRSIEDLRKLWMFTPDDPGFGWGDEYRNDTVVRDSSGNIPNASSYFSERQVSLVPGEGLLRLSAVRLDTVTPVWSEQYRAYRYCRYESGMIKLRRDVSGPPFEGCVFRKPEDPADTSLYSGFTYGLFEIRMKIPEGITFPAFWLAGPSQINIYEGKFWHDKMMAGFSNFWQNTHGHYTEIRMRGGRNLSDDFHTYTGVWTPHRLTFFIDGRELVTYTGPDVDALQHGGAWCEANTILANLQMVHWSDLAACHMDIDYIRVYKPDNNDYSQPYQSPLKRKKRAPWRIVGQ